MNGYDQNNSNQVIYVRQKSNRPAIIVSVVCLVLCAALLVSAIAVGTYCVQQVNTGKTELKSGEEYEATIESLNSQIKNLTTQLSGIQRQTAGTTPVTETVDLTSTAALARQSVVCVTVTIPSKTYQFGFYTYQSGGGYSTGSGVILTEDGYIVTNYHVVSYYDEYENVTIDVTFADGTTAEATLVGGDKSNDLAVLKVDASTLNLTTAVFGDSDALLVGQTVIAVGNPLGIEFAGTVTTGIVSALDRMVSEENTSEKLIQTDAAINPGNSGGGLFTADGKLVGITSSKIVDTDVEGIGFAIPINYAAPILNDLIEYGYVKGRPATGISGETLSASVARRYGLPAGIVVTSVASGSGAEQAGIKINDIITEVNGVAVTKMSDIQSVDNSFAVGSTIDVTYYRNGQYHKVQLLLMEDRGR